MRRKKKSENNGFNVWRSYSDMMAGVLLLFVLIMCVTLFQAQKSYNESLQERDEKSLFRKNTHRNCWINRMRWTKKMRHCRIRMLS